MNIDQLIKLYSGFYIKDEKGNNTFSLADRKQKEIFVLALKQGSFADLRVGNQIVFSEFFEGKEINCCGLENFIYVPFNDKHVFVFDNHNHAFVFWFWGYLQGIFKAGQRLVHIDQHKDTREPAEHLDASLDQWSLKQVFDYTQDVLNVGNFISPALKAGLFSEVDILDNESAFRSIIKPAEVLDLDMDIFSPEMDYIDRVLKIKVVREYFQQAKLITIATSPYFIDQDKVIDLIKELFSEE